MDIMKMQNFIKKELTSTPPAGSNLKVGDTVRWTNDYGVSWEHQIIGFNYTFYRNEKYHKFVHLNSGCYWSSHDHRQLTVIKAN